VAHGPSLEGRARAARQKSVFLNLPYDARFRSLFLAYVAGTSAFGLIPRATLEIPSRARPLDPLAGAAPNLVCAGSAKTRTSDPRL